MSILTNISLRYKLLLGFFLVVFIFTAFVVYFLFRINTVDNSLRDLNNRSAKLQLFLKLQLDNQQLSNAVKSYILTKNPVWEKTYDQTASELSQTLQGLQSVTETDEVAKLNEFETITNKIQGTELLILSKTKDGDTQGAITLFDNNYEHQQTEATNLIAQLVKGEDTDFFLTLEQDNNNLNTSRNLLFFTGIFILFITLAMAFAITSLIEQSIKKLVESVNKIAAGDLQVRVPVVSHDEIGKLAEAFNDMTQKLATSYQSLEEKIKQRTEELEKAKTGLEAQVQERTKELQVSKINLESEVAKRTQELQEKITELERINSAMVDRELKMVELKERIKVLELEKSNESNKH